MPLGEGRDGLRTTFPGRDCDAWKVPRDGAAVRGGSQIRSGGDKSATDA
jgi:hypothetical protein